MIFVWYDLFHFLLVGHSRPQTNDVRESFAAIVSYLWDYNSVLKLSFQYRSVHSEISTELFL